jgi:hypothetical protein
MALGFEKPRFLYRCPGFERKMTRREAGFLFLALRRMNSLGNGQEIGCDIYSCSKVTRVVLGVSYEPLASLM